MMAYEAVRIVQWALLLRALTPAPPWRTATMAYLGGELIRGFPAGQYVQTILLRRARGTPIADSVAATWLILWIEAAVCLLVVGLFGAMPWPWLRPLAWGLLAGIGAVLCLVGIMLMHRVVCGALTAGLTTAGLVALRRQVGAAWRGGARHAPRTELPALAGHSSRPTRDIAS